LAENDPIGLLPPALGNGAAMFAALFESRNPAHGSENPAHGLAPWRLDYPPKALS
jgi:hypothetical protein